MSDEELRFVNAFIGFCTPIGDTWPAPFADGNYLVTGVERPVNVTVDGVPKAPVPEMISTSSIKQHCVIIEAKSGSVDDGQARGYARIEPWHLISQGLATPEVDEKFAKVDVLYVCMATNAGRLTADFDRAAVDFPIVSYGDNIFDLIHGAIVQSEMDAIFRRGIPVNPDHWPNHFVRCDRESSAGQLAVVVMGRCVALLLRQGEFSIEELCRVSVDFWDLRGSEDQRRFRGRITELVSEAEQTELGEYINRVRSEQKWGRIGEKKWQPQTIDRLSDKVEDFVRRIQANASYNPGQPPLFSYSDQ